MSLEKFNEIINFAVEREKEAVQFYSDLLNMTKFDSKKIILNSLVQMEKGHIEVLENIRKQEIAEVEIPKVQDLKISDYMVESKPTSDMSYQDILLTAMKREEASFNLYTDLANQMADANTKKVFEKLASEEAKHKNQFETIYEDEVLKEN